MKLQTRHGEEEEITQTTYQSSDRIRDWVTTFDACPRDGDTARPFTLVLDGESQTAKDARE